MSKKLLFILIAGMGLVAFMFHSCYYDNMETLYPKNDTLTSDCDTANVTYAVQVKSFFDAHCISCHSSGGTYPALDNYSGAHDYATLSTNKIYNYISTGHQGVSPSACEKAQIKKWIDTGAN
jgi:hypothetical protein